MNAKGIRFLAAAGTITIAQAAASAPLEVQGRASRVEVARPDGDRGRLILRIIPRPGWHTYWLNPGDAGAPPRLDWDQHPTNQSMSMEAPEKIVADGITSFGFRRPVNLIATVSFARAASPRGTLSWVMCDGRSCFPERAMFSLGDVPITGEAEPKLPGKARDTNWSIKPDVAILTLPPQDRRAVTTAYFFPLEQGVLAPATPQSPSRTPGGDWRLTLRMKHARAHAIPGVLSVQYRDGTCASYAVDASPASVKSHALRR